jgi:hypothetical protein
MRIGMVFTNFKRREAWRSLARKPITSIIGHATGPLRGSLPAGGRNGHAAQRIVNVRLPDLRARARPGALATTFLALVATRAQAAEVTPSFVAKLVPEPPGLAVIATARTNQIPLDAFTNPTPGTKLVPGDSITALVTMHDRKASRLQWLIYVQIVASTNLSPAKTNEPLTLYSSRGTRFQFASSPVSASLRTLGPFRDTPGGRKAPKLKDHQEAFSLDESFLGLGLDKAAAALVRLRGTEIKGNLSFGSEAPPADKAAENRRLADAVGLSLAEERSLAGALPALISFFELVQHTEGLEEILYKIVDLPPLWSIVWHVGVRADIRFVSEEINPARIADWGLPGGPEAFYFPVALRLNNHPALKVTVVVTRPVPPLLACGGVLGFVAERPNDPDMYLTLRVISARHSP